MLIKALCASLWFLFHTYLATREVLGVGLCSVAVQNEICDNHLSAVIENLLVIIAKEESS